MMPCHHIGNGIIVCTGRQRRQRCHVDGCGRWAIVLCDYELSIELRDRRVYAINSSKTCDAPMCARHRHSVGPDKDLCGAHLNAAEQLELPISTQTTGGR